MKTALYLFSAVISVLYAAWMIVLFLYSGFNQTFIWALAIPTGILIWLLRSFHQNSKSTKLKVYIVIIWLSMILISYLFLREFLIADYK